MAREQKAVLAGVDGSAPALDAVRWAARDAALRKRPLRLIHVGEDADCLAEAETAAAAVPDGQIRGGARTGHPAERLIEESATAVVVVLGSHGLGGFPGMLLGSVAGALAAHAHCPVVVVRGAPPADAPVVVGIDASPGGDAALAFALDEANLRRVPLLAVHTWTDMTMGETWSVLPMDADYGAIAEDERRLLAERLAGWREKYPDVDVRPVVVRDRPVRGLLAAGQDAQLIVVGSRGRADFGGVGLGSTSQALLHHAPCPVAVVR
ncbi:MULTISPECIES: universal stress protein [Amycolatopsis]|uniref:Universal stress protein n=1 Tax=Amycolatopsis tucumanensis TaxID=401106 RepID=A0ABP7HHM9_9PSEU|nr:MULTISPECIES: universal stress protein [Amycolatopsis]MCF6428983.1 universal stress protein [Amycolatopsis tucumanensis]